MILNLFFLISAAVLSVTPLQASSCYDLSLNGKWEYGLDRCYSGITDVPGFPLENSEIADEPLWYRKTLTLPAGDWDTAALELKGARFRPEVYINGRLSSRREGGMARTTHPLSGIRPGERIRLEIRLASLKETPKDDASYIPAVDQWRSNVASCLWDDVVLHLYKGARADRLLINYDSGKKSAAATFRVRGSGAAKAVLTIFDGERELFNLESEGSEGEHTVEFECAGLAGEWTPEHPTCYRALVRLFDAGGNQLSEYSQTVGLREFGVDGNLFRLNGKPYRVRGGSLVWHRWMRDSDSREIGLSREWIENNVGKRIKERGGNYLRFHLGVPPERILDMCDSLGLAVQYEWSFFHGMPASLESLMEQYAEWLDMASRHPSVMLVHPYNETNPQELVRVWKALDSLTVHYPPMVLADRDIFHIHRYWWGMSENLGLYFNSYEQFRKPIVVDEFGGIYLDGDGNFGGYPMLPGAMLRLLGYDNTAQMRLHQQDLAYGKVGEYWRRIGAAGVAAFPIICSWNDGNHWYEGPIAEGRLKNVWSKMTAVWADRVASMDVWNRDYTAGERLSFPIQFINDTPGESVLEAKFEVLDADGNVLSEKLFSEEIPANSSRSVRLKGVSMPRKAGNYLFRTTLLNPSEGITEPVVSEWEVRVIKAEVPSNLKDVRIWAPRSEREIRKMARRQGLNLTGRASRADLLVLGRKGWENFDKWRSTMDKAVSRGASVVLLEAGNRGLGIAYNDDQDELESLSGAPKLSADEKNEIETTDLIAGLKIRSVKATEGESHIQPPKESAALWNGLEREWTYLWNGLRGGIIVPAYNMEAEGISADAFLAQWSARGADIEKIKTGPYFAYEYCGFYTFSFRADDPEADKFLKDKVKFLVEDMPALELSLPRYTPTRITDLHEGYVATEGIRVSRLTPLVVAGKNLVRTPVIKVNFGEGEGSMVISQLYTEGRLAKGCAEKRRYYPVVYDEAAVQFVLNIFSEALKD